uniref:(E)-beta-farnesene synthase-like n=1 Tax=Erigeron canadensis TaxID=72917 RepID=UPI001CB973BF|nr:(E)-beta-farnesene synthase-like [Erigeron canadensis]
MATSLNMPILASSSPDNDQGTKNDVVRNTMNSQRSIWGDMFLTYNETKDQAYMERRAKELKEEVRKTLVITSLTEPIQHVKLLEHIDAVQRLGVAYHFDDEIEECLKHIYVAYGDRWINNNDLQSTSLWFRLLRQQGFNISSEIFNKYKSEKGTFMESMKDDVGGMLSLYEATFMRIEGEKVLEEALDFTKYHLGNIVNNHTLNIDTLLETKVHQALEQPIRKMLPRLEALRYIPIYEQEDSHNEDLLTFAKLDFNLLQELHRKELSLITKWWKDLDVSSKLPYVRDRIVEGYFWVLAIYYEPQHSDTRIFLMKACNLGIILDDTYDNYGTYEELKIFTEAIERWSTSCLDMLPEYMKMIYQELIDVHKEAEEMQEKKGNAYRSYYAKEMVKDCARNLLIESKWVNEGYIATLEEHLSVTLVTCQYAMIVAKCYVHGDDLITEDAFKWVSTYPPIVKASCLILRLMDDIATHKKEQERNHVASSIECYMKQYGVSEEQACEALSKQVEDSWKVINKETLRPTDVPRPLLTPPINLARVCDVLYKRGDNYTYAGKEMIKYINSLLVNAMSL